MMLKTEFQKTERLTLMEGRGDSVDTIVPRAAAAGRMPVAKTLGTTLRVSLIQVVVTWSTPAVEF